MVHMRTIIPLILMITFASPASVLAQSPSATAPATGKPLQTFTLDDGTVLKGHLTGVNDDTYVIETQTIGKINVTASRIVSMTSGNVQHPPSAPSLASRPGLSSGGLTPLAGMNAAQLNLFSDPQLLTQVQELLNDPAIMAVINNPDVMQDLLSQDPLKIQNNAEIQQLLNNPKIQNIINAAGQKWSVPENGPGTPPQH